ncbi:MAG: four helix bundle protein [Acidobacteria bacterium]|nr:four helix bundle protein [Acidobacteriota bacterium]
MATKIYSDLIVWQRAMDLVEQVYLATKLFPKEEMYGLCSQQRRASISIPSNIAEGQGRNSAKEFLHFLSIAYGSLREAETQILIAGRLKYLEQQQVNVLMELAGEVGRLLNGLSKSLSV